MLHAKFSVNRHSCDDERSHLIKGCQCSPEGLLAGTQNLAGTSRMSFCRPTAGARRVEIGGSVCESNAPLTSKMPIAGFEDMLVPHPCCADSTTWLSRVVLFGHDCGIRHSTMQPNMQPDAGGARNPSGYISSIASYSTRRWSKRAK